MSIISNSDVFEFCGTPSDIQTTQGPAVTNLIARCQDEIEKLIGRKVESTDFSAVLFHDGLNCEIYEDKLFFRGKYRDIFSITSIFEAGTLLNVVSDYNDSGDYFFDSRLGVLTRHRQNWTQEQFGIKITGKLGLLGTWASPTFTPNQDIKQILIEIVAIRSGLWKKTVETEDGSVTVERSLAKRFESLQKYMIGNV